MTLPAQITIAGLGPGPSSLRSIMLETMIDSADTVVLRTAIHPDLTDIEPLGNVVACDDIYELGQSFDQIYREVADRVIQCAESGSVLYLVTGSPLFGESTVQFVVESARSLGIETSILPAVSGLDAVAADLECDLMSEQVQILDGIELARMVVEEPFSGGTARFDPCRPMFIGQVYSRAVASDVKHLLFRLFSETHVVTVVRSAGDPNRGELRSVPLHDLDHGKFDHLTSVWIPPLEQFDGARSPATLLELVSYLRSPAGCPWDREQSHATLRDKIIEEAHEVVDAIDSGDDEELAAELGDLLLVIAMNAQIAEERSAFTYEDVYASVNEKLVRRHPHVFGDEHADSAESVLKTWKQVKASERNESEIEAESRLRYDELPKSLSVISRIRIAEIADRGSNNQPGNDIGKMLLSLIESAFEAGFDPEQLIEHAYREAKLSASQR